MKKLLFFALFLFGIAISLYSQPKLSADNVDEVLKAMTLEEKAALLVGGGWGSMSAGSMTASSTILVPGAAGTTRGIDRLGIPRTVVADGPAGLRISPTREGDSNTYYCTGFPVGTSMASMWNVNLVEELTTAMGEEVKEYGVDVLLAPGLNLHRNPLCGRNFEYYSEDPFLTGKIAAAYINGVQSNGVGVSAKHYAANNQETERLSNSTDINQRTLREMYLKGFEIVVKESKPWTIMSSYNKINDVFTQEDKELLTTILRDEWGFDGIVMTDWTGIRNTAAQVKAGNDLMEPGAQNQIDDIINSVKEGRLDEKDIDICAKRILEYIVKTPRFKGYKYSNKPKLEEHANLVRKAAAEGMVLLENKDNLLPLKGVKKVALYGTGSYDFIAGGTGSGNVNKPYIRNVAQGLEANGFEVEASINDWYEKYIEFTKTTNRNNSRQGRGILLGEAVIPEMEVSRAFIESKVESTDIAIITISRNAGEGGDRKALDGDWTLTGQEREMIQTLSDVYHLAGKKVVVVLNIGGVIETASWKHIPDAILLAWTPGQEGGYSVADILSGKSYPSGKLPMTFPVQYFDIPSSANFPFNYNAQQRNTFSRNSVRKPVSTVDYTDYSEGIYVGYRYFTTANKEVSYPFGFGLSYTKFEFSSPSLKVTSNGWEASITVKNVGEAVGKEVVQIYVTAPAGGLEKPKYELKGFAKTNELKPGESQVVTIPIDMYSLASFNEATSQWETAAGQYTVHFAHDANTISKTISVKIAKPKSWKVNNVMAPKKKIEEMSLLKR